MKGIQSILTAPRTGRDIAHTKYLLSKEVDWGIDINYIMKDEGLPEVKCFLTAQ